LRAICCRQTREVFQSSRMSWSSKIIADGTVDSSQRIHCSENASRYSSVYSSKSAISMPGACETSRRARMNSCIGGDVASAYTWSPSSRTAVGHSSSDAVASRRAYARSTSMPNFWLCASSCGTLRRHDPNTSRSRSDAGSNVRIRGGGNVEPGSGQTCSPFSASV
jgi:hypothetical protein